MPSGHAKAAVDGTVIADATAYEVVENNIYFPPSAIKSEYFSKTDHSTHCPWKGDANYYTIKVGDKNLDNAAWYYSETKEKANHIKGYVAFYQTKVDITTE